METNYRNTLNLPKTDFPMKAELPKKEPEILKRWESIGLYSKIRTARGGCEKYVLHDGPPYANGDVHLGTGLNKVLKDIVVRFKTMEGKDSPFIPGWDCHGMPIEYNVIKNSESSEKIKDKVLLRKLCREYAAKYVDIQREQFKRLGVSADWENPYLTMSSDYEATILEAFGRLVQEGYIYNGLKPVFWCGHCQTALANAEVEYEDIESPSVCMKFPVLSDIEGEKKAETFILVWTTMPWTLLGNVAVAVHPDFEYVLVEKDIEVWILAEALLEDVLTKSGSQKGNVVKKIKGKKLEGLICKPPFLERESKIVCADFVTLKQGTGCVHIAPGHGFEDFSVASKYGLPVFTPVDERGRFTIDTGEFLSLYVFDADEKIILKIKEQENLVYSQKIVHSYPHCWRCKKPVIFRATQQWFLSLEVNSLKSRMQKQIPGIRWIPQWAEDKFKDTIGSSPDWCISRQRAWGVPIPALSCSSCRFVLLSGEVVKNLSELVRQEKLEVWFKEGIEEKVAKGIKCPRCGCDKFQKQTDILDVWVDSGMSSVAVLDKNPALPNPSDLYLEAVDQHRGWFQISLIISMALKDRAPYKSVLTHGLILDETGRKMSKLLGNVIAPQEIVAKYGSDVLRLWFVSVDYTSDMRMSQKNLLTQVDTYRKIRNTCRFLLGNIYDFDPEKDFIQKEQMVLMDRWILACLNKILKSVLSSYGEFSFYKVIYLLHNFCTIELSSFYLDVLKDRMYASEKNSIERRSGQTAMYLVLKALTKAVAPIIPFTADEVWMYISGRKEESVHLCRFDELKEYEDEKIIKYWEGILKLKKEVLKHIEIARTDGIVHESLELEILFSCDDKNPLKILIEEWLPLLPTVFITSSVRLVQEEGHQKIPVCGISGLDGKQIDGSVGISIKKAEGKKCQRCWMFDISVSKNEKHPSLCKRCARVVSCTF